MIETLLTVLARSGRRHEPPPLSEALVAMYREGTDWECVLNALQAATNDGLLELSHGGSVRLTDLGWDIVEQRPTTTVTAARSPGSAGTS